MLSGGDPSPSLRSGSGWARWQDSLEEMGPKGNGRDEKSGREGREVGSNTSSEGQGNGPLPRVVTARRLQSDSLSQPNPITLSKNQGKERVRSKLLVKEDGTDGKFTIQKVRGDVELNTNQDAQNRHASNLLSSRNQVMNMNRNQPSEDQKLQFERSSKLHQASNLTDRDKGNQRKSCPVCGFDQLPSRTCRRCRAVMTVSKQKIDPSQDWKHVNRRRSSAQRNEHNPFDEREKGLSAEKQEAEESLLTKVLAESQPNHVGFLDTRKNGTTDEEITAGANTDESRPVQSVSQNPRPQHQQQQQEQGRELRLNEGQLQSPSPVAKERNNGSRKESLVARSLAAKNVENSQETAPRDSSKPLTANKWAAWRPPVSEQKVPDASPQIVVQSSDKSREKSPKKSNEHDSGVDKVSTLSKLKPTSLNERPTWRFPVSEQKDSTILRKASMSPKSPADKSPPEKTEVGLRQGQATVRSNPGRSASGGWVTWRPPVSEAPIAEKEVSDVSHAALANSSAKPVDKSLEKDSDVNPGKAQLSTQPDAKSPSSSRQTVWRPTFSAQQTSDTSHTALAGISDRPVGKSFEKGSDLDPRKARHSTPLTVESPSSSQRKVWRPTLLTSDVHHPASAESSDKPIDKLNERRIEVDQGKSQGLNLSSSKWEDSTTQSLDSVTGKDAQKTVSSHASQDTLPRDEVPDVDGTRKARRNARFLNEFAPSPPIGNQRQKERRRGRQNEDYESDFEDEESAAHRRSERKKERKKERLAQKAAAPPTPILLPEFISIGNLAAALRVRVEDFAQKMEDLGFEETSNDYVLDAETAGLIAAEFNYEPMIEKDEVEDLVARPPVDDKTFLLPRPPVVTIMGHVDHGKTTLLDYLRKSSVAASEHGGITQHIGAFMVPMPSGRTITFLDTPGHAAFLSMRQRGANVTDIVILVVAADDSVKPQTIEAIKHAQAANVPMIVAINKVDKEGSNIERVKQDLARHGVDIEDFGGETQVVCVSGKTGQGMDELEDAAVALADILDMRAETDGQAEGWILEATTKKGGRVATVLVRLGTISPGNIMVAGSTWTRVRTLRNEAGLEIHSAGPGTPVEVDGWREQPEAGDEVLQAPNEQTAKEVVDLRRGRLEQKKLAADVTAVNEARQEQSKREQEQFEEQPGEPDAEGVVSAEQQQRTTGVKEVYFVIKADVSGSVEAVLNSVSGLGNEEVRPHILRSAVGPVAEFDVDHAAAAKGHIISFNNPLDQNISRMAEAAGVQILDQNIIYRLIDDVRAKLSEHLAPVMTQRVLGEAEIAQVFEISTKGRKTSAIAGCKVRNGVVGRNAKARVVREGKVVYDGLLTSLKSAKKDVGEIRKGSECGMGFDNFEAFKVGDQVQCYEEKAEKRFL